MPWVEDPSNERATCVRNVIRHALRARRAADPEGAEGGRGHDRTCILRGTCMGPHVYLPPSPAVAPLCSRSFSERGSFSEGDGSRFTTSDSRGLPRPHSTWRCLRPHPSIPRAELFANIAVVARACSRMRADALRRCRRLLAEACVDPEVRKKRPRVVPFISRDPRRPEDHFLPSVGIILMYTMHFSLPRAQAVERGAPSSPEAPGRPKSRPSQRPPPPESGGAGEGAAGGSPPVVHLRLTRLLEADDVIARRSLALVARALTGRPFGGRGSPARDLLARARAEGGRLPGGFPLGGCVASPLPRSRGRILCIRRMVAGPGRRDLNNLKEREGIAALLSSRDVRKKDGLRPSIGAHRPAHAANIARYIYPQHS